MIEGDALPALDAGRVRLRWLTAGDVDALFAIFSDEQMMRYWSSAPMKARSEAEELLARIHRQFGDKSGFQWGVERKADGELIGTCTLFNIHRANMRAEIGYCLRSRHWGQGYMGEALAALIDYAFDALELRRLEADVDPKNSNSLRILARMGFQREGLLRERWNVGGDIQDSVFLGLLAREWRARRGIRIVAYRREHAADFRRLNIEWIERLFTVEAHDLEVLDDPESAIVAPGGMIFFALDGCAVVGTVAMIRGENGRCELAKMAVAASHQRRGIGELLGGAGTAWARRQGFARAFLETNSRLGGAIRLYERLGFRHAPRPHPTDYARSDVYMELELDPARS
ncbi:MAG TPA: GNAT family N-acetyltransferase [Steroidobacteraceae bacterium]|nr:GNAT family N-acetyltransferase [Steroidobacteraceae bacterium]